MGYAKLFGSICESSLWSETKETRLLFVTMLAKADQSGFVEASLPGLARIANLTMDETSGALTILTGPDPHSKNPNLNGQRLEKIPRGWLILNYRSYQSSSEDGESRREYMRGYMRHRRQRQRKDVNNVNNVNNVNKQSLHVNNKDHLSPTETKESVNNSVNKKTGEGDLFTFLGKQKDLNLKKKRSKKEKERKAKEAREQRKSEILEVFDHYRTWHPQALKKPSCEQKEWKKVAGRLAEGRTVKELKKAIDGCHHSSFHLGDNSEGIKYLSLELIIRDDSHVQKFIELDERRQTLPTKSVFERLRELDGKEGDDDGDHS